MTVNGVSTCTKAGTEKYEAFETGFGRKKVPLSSTIIGQKITNCSHVSAPHWSNAEPKGTNG